MPKVKMNGKTVHLPYTKKGMAKAKMMMKPPKGMGPKMMEAGKKKAKKKK